MDMSDVFWEFVDAVSALPHDQLVMTEMYTRIADAVHAGNHVFALAASTLHVDGTDLRFEGIGGVTYDNWTERFLFQDVTALFMGCHGIICMSAEVSCNVGASQLSRCIRRMTGHIDILELGYDMAANMRVS